MKIDELFPFTPFHQIEETPYPDENEEFNEDNLELDNDEEL